MTGGEVRRIRHTRPVFDRLLAALRVAAPPILPVQVRRVAGLPKHEGARVFGDCALIVDPRGRPTRFSIRVCRSGCKACMVDTLLHEWAHALGYTSDHPSVDDHGPEWGLQYARVLRVYEDLP